MDEQSFHTILKKTFVNYVLDHYPWPRAFCIDPPTVRAIVLGADPSHKARKGKTWKPLEYDFALEDGETNLYSSLNAVPIGPSDNKLERPLIPLFRHRKYDLASPKWSTFARNIRTILQA